MYNGMNLYVLLQKICMLLFSIALIGCSVTQPMLSNRLQGDLDKQASTAESNSTHQVSSYHPVGVPQSAWHYYQSVWGVDNLLVRIAASGSLVRFSYRVTNPALATELGDKHAKPALYDPRSRAVLQIPVLEQVGALWQAAVEMKMEKGKQYWMTFSNKGEPVKAGDRVTVVIGAFHADGLMVEE